MQIEIYTDGSCKGNPGPGGWGAILVVNKQEITLRGGEKDSTNNRMEMMAMIKALEYLKTGEVLPLDELNSTKIKIYSDSNLIVQTLTQNWKRKKNTDLWADLDKARAWLDVDYIWVKGHSTHVYNNRVDEIAQKEADKQR